jgi:hypothetical protein
MGVVAFLSKYRLLAYMLRWQLSTPILALAVIFVPGSTLFRTIVANLIGSMVFFKVDKRIMKGGK